MIRGGHIDVCVMGAFQVSQRGDLANWSTGAADAVPAVGGAMDLAAGAKSVYVMMSLFAKDGSPKLVPQCTFPLTGQGCVSRVYTESAIFQIDAIDGVAVLETFGMSISELYRSTFLSAAWLTTRRRRTVPVGRFDATTGQWTDVDAAGAVDRDELTLATYNSGTTPSTPSSVISRSRNCFPDVLPTSWCSRKSPRPRSRSSSPSRGSGTAISRAAIVDGDVGNYGMLMLSRLPITYDVHPAAHPPVTRIPSGRLPVNGNQIGRLLHASRQREVVVAAATLAAAQNFWCAESGGKRCAAWRFQHARRRECAHRCALLRHMARLEAHQDGFTEDTTINLMRYDMKNKHRHVRFDRMLLKGRHWTAAHIELLGTEPISSRPASGVSLRSLRFGMPAYKPKSIGPTRPGPPQTCRRPPWRDRSTLAGADHLIVDGERCLQRLQFDR